MTIPMRTAIVALLCAIAAAAIIVPLGQYLFGIAVADAAFAALGSAWIEGLFTFAVFGLLLGIALIGIHLSDGWSGLIGAMPVAMAGAGVAAGLGGLAMATGYAAIGGHVGTGEGAALSFIIGTLAVAFQSATEEIYFRGWIQPLLVRAFGIVPGICVVALVFAALHVAGGVRSPVTMLNLFLGGIVFGLMAVRSGGLMLPMGMHFAWNWAEMIALGLTPNPGVGSFGAIVNLDIAAPAYWGGSEEGLNGSIGMSLVLIALILPFALWRSGLTLSGRPTLSDSPG